MLQIKHIFKQYKTGTLIQTALDGVSLNLRENEFVAILGPSGSGKTTLLNIIGGLDRYDSGDLVINGISTKKYKDRDWDSYRNHTVGFVFQSYNLIPHQTILSNVELALTISGVSRTERRRRAVKALEQVGLGEQLHKKPGQMSGGQMQRVAIARALVNDPDILLADEPTGALDSETSIQVMELLKEVAKDRLVVMVTHNPELAQQYATRIVKLKDGKIIADSDPYEPEEAGQPAPVHRNMGKASMSFFTALSLSFHNLRTKKARTLLTSFAGSIGIIGIALILALSTGVNNYIQSMEEDTLSEYPVQIQSSGMDFASMMGDRPASGLKDTAGEVGISQRITAMLAKVQSNDLGALKAYFDSGASGIEAYANAVEYSYSAVPYLFREDGGAVRQVNPDRFFSSIGVGSTGTNSMMSMMMNTDVFHRMPENESLYRNQYEIKAGRWPERYDECVVVLTAGGNISDLMLYALGLRDASELDEMIAHFRAEEDIEVPDGLRTYQYEELLGIRFKLVSPADFYEYDSEYRVWKDKTGDADYMKKLVSEGEDITIVGVVKPSDEADAAMLSSGIGYPASLTRHIMELSAASPVVRQQLENPACNVLTGEPFGADNGNRLELSTLFSIDKNALADAFQIDTDSMNMDLSDAFDFSAVDLGGMLDLTDIILELDSIDLEELLGQLDLTVSTEQMVVLAKNLIEGYQAYAATHPEADFSRLGECFLEYLQSPEARQRLSDGIGTIIEENGGLSVSAEQLAVVIQEVMAGFQEYAAANGMTDPEEINAYLAAYLQTPEAQQKLAEGVKLLLQMAGEIEVTPEQLNALANDMVLGYQEYAAANSLPDPSKMGEQFLAYLQTPEAQQILAQGIGEIVNVKELEVKIGELMQSVMGSVSDSIQEQLSRVMQKMMSQLAAQLQNSMVSIMEQMGQNMGNALRIDVEALQKAIKMNMDEGQLQELMMSLLSSEETSYEANLKNFGYVDPAQPSGIDIYPRDFGCKTSILNILDEYNDRMEAAGMQEKVIGYTDMVGTLMSSVTEIVDTISYVLIAFVAVSLVVSSIMIGVITYISVLERRKEIGILRAIGASKGNISQVFNAETFIVGLCAGLMGVGLALLLLIPGNTLIHSLAGRSDINASLPAVYGAVLILLSIILTLIGGLIPSRKAAKSDPVTALRTE